MFRRKFQTDRLTIAKIRYKFKADGTVQNVHKRSLKIPASPTSQILSDRNLMLKLTGNCSHAAHEVGLSKSSVHCILKRHHWKSYIPIIVYALSSAENI